MSCRAGDKIVDRLISLFFSPSTLTIFLPCSSQCHLGPFTLPRSIRSFSVYGMAPQKLPLWADEERGKKDDDHRPLPTRFEPRRQWKTPRPRRILLTLVAVGALWLFFKHMPTDLAPAAERYNPDLARLRQQIQVPRPDAAKIPAIPQAEPSQQNQEIDLIPEDEYDGEVQFYQLAKSLPRHKYLEKEKMASSAVVFAASSLHCVSDLLPLACRMAGKRVNIVHFVLMGKDEVSIEGIKEVNRITDSECPMTWHGVF